MISLQSLLKSSDKITDHLPSLLSNSSLILKNIYEGLHSTRFAGKGENFWQFKEYSYGENVASIDWRKSASSKKILIKQNEKELSKTIYLYFDNSLSMNYQSNYSSHSKLYISALLTLSLCKLFSYNKEEVFIFNSEVKPIKCSNNINNFNNSFLSNNKIHNLPHLNLFKDKSLCFFFSDFMFEKKDLNNLLYKFKKRGILGYLIQVLDPMEISLKFEANVMLKDLETKKTISLHKDKDILNAYQKKLNELEMELKKMCFNSGWKYFKFITNQNIGEFLIDLSKTFALNKK